MKENIVENEFLTFTVPSNSCYHYKESVRQCKNKGVFWFLCVLQMSIELSRNIQLNLIVCIDKFTNTKQSAKRKNRGSCSSFN